jgi:hypothetical protein
MGIVGRAFGVDWAPAMVGAMIVPARQDVSKKYFGSTVSSSSNGFREIGLSEIRTR